MLKVLNNFGHWWPELWLRLQKRKVTRNINYLDMPKIRIINKIKYTYIGPEGMKLCATSLTEPHEPKKKYYCLAVQFYFIGKENYEDFVICR